VQQLTTDCQAIEAFVVPRVLWPDDIGETSRALAVFAVALAPPGTRSEQISDIVRALASVKCVGSRESLDLAIAWGCGWHRNIAPHSTGAEGRWPLAVFAVAALAESALTHTWRQFAAGVPGFMPLSQPDLRKLADRLALQLITGTCECGRHVRPCAGGSACRCCRPAHRLANWRPELFSLAPFVAQAVRGWAVARRPPPSAYEVSMMYPLTQFMGLETGCILERKCRQCGVLRTSPRPCVECGQLSSEEQDWHGKRCHQYVLPVESDGNHVLEHRWRCQACDNLFLDEFPVCPRCQGRRAKRTTAVWDERRPGVYADIDDPAVEAGLYQASRSGHQAHMALQPNIWMDPEADTITQAMAFALLGDPEPQRRAAAVDYVAETRDPAAIARVAGMLDDPDSLVRGKAHELLSEIERLDLDRAADAASRSGDVAAAAAARRLLQDRDP